MSDLDKYLSTDITDRYMRQSLRNWAANQQPPANSRARLMLIASSPLAFQERLSRYDVCNRVGSQAPGTTASEMAMERFNQPWLWVLHLTVSPLRHVA